MDKKIFKKKIKDRFCDDIEREIFIKAISSIDIKPNEKYIIHADPDNRIIDVFIRDLNDPQYLIKDQCLIIFGGWGDTFNILISLLKYYKGYFIYFNDKYNEWYKSLMSAYVDIILEYAITIQKYIFFGWSMGGYGALAASLLVNKYGSNKSIINITLNAQTINFNNYKRLIIKDTQSPQIQAITDIHFDIINLLKEDNSKTKIYALLGRTECDDYKEHNTPLYLDSIHIGSLLLFPNVYVIISKHDTHRLIGKLNFIKILTIFNSEDQFDIFYSNQKTANEILNLHIEDKLSK